MTAHPTQAYLDRTRRLGSSSPTDVEVSWRGILARVNDEGHIEAAGIEDLEHFVSEWAQRPHSWTHERALYLLRRAVNDGEGSDAGWQKALDRAQQRQWSALRQECHDPPFRGV